MKKGNAYKYLRSVRCHYQISQLNRCADFEEMQSRNEQHNKPSSWCELIVLPCLHCAYCVVTGFNLFKLAGIKGIHVSGVCIHIKYHLLCAKSVSSFVYACCFTMSFDRL